MASTNCFYETVSCTVSAGHRRITGIRLDRVLDIRDRLRSGRYNPDEHLSIVLDRLLEEILFQDTEK